MTAILDPKISLYDFCTNEKLFRKLDPLGESWFGWNTIFKVLSGMKLNREEGKFFHKVSGGLRYRQGKMPQDLVSIIGRKGGKSNTISRISLYHTMRFDPEGRGHFKPVSPGEEPSNIIICPNFRTSLIDIKFTKGMLEEDDSMSGYLRHSKQTEQIAELTIANGCYIRLIPVTGVSGRGPSTYCLILDEAAFFRKKGLFCDSKIFDDARPGMARFGDTSRYFILTSPGRKDGLVWNYYQQYFGVENDECLVINGSSKDFNPSLSDDFLEKELIRGGESFFQREYLGKFVDAIEAAYSEQSVNRGVVRADRVADPDEFVHFGVVDPAGLSPQSINNDDYAIGVAHNELRGRKWVTVIDRFAGWCANPGSVPRVTNPRIAIEESIKTFKEYNIRKIMTDRAKTEWVQREYEDAGFEVLQAPPKNDLYLALEPALNSGAIEYPPHRLAIQQLKSLERMAGRTDKDKIDHAPTEHDDYANIVALAAYFGNSLITPPIDLSDVHMGGERTGINETFDKTEIPDDWREML